MTAKEKAKELIKRMDVKHYIELRMEPKYEWTPVSMYDSQIEQCALVCVNEIIDCLWMVDTSVVSETLKYYEEVKQEINKL